MSNFPKMGTEAASANNVSGAPSANTTLVPKQGSSGGAPDASTKGNRQGVLERNGFKGAPQTAISYPNAPEAANTLRNVRLVPSAVGNRDFYLKRQYGQAAQ
jgi:hypothetical protein